MSTFIPATNDFLFKSLLMNNLDVLQDYLCDLLHVTVTGKVELEIWNPEMELSPYDDWLTLEVHVKSAEGTFKAITQSTPKGVADHCVATWFRFYAKNCGANPFIDDFEKTFTLHICGNSFTEGTPYRSTYSFHEVESFMPLTDVMSIQVVELPKVPDEIDGADNQLMWMRLFKAKSAKALEEVKSVAQSPAIKKAVDAILAMNNDPDFLERLRQFNDALDEEIKERRKAEEKGGTDE